MNVKFQMVGKGSLGILKWVFMVQSLGPTSVTEFPNSRFSLFHLQMKNPFNISSFSIILVTSD